MSQLPQIDPNWTRRRRAATDDNSVIWLALTTLAVVSLLVWLFRGEAQFATGRNAAEAQSQALAKEALLRQKDAMALGPSEISYISEAEANRQIAAANGSFQDETIYHCVSASVDTYQLGPCRAPLVEARYSRDYSRRDAVEAQARMRMRAEAQLRAEEQRFAALTGQTGGTWTPGIVGNPPDASRQYCEEMKAQRDAAYRAVGNNRTFDFIRGWDDVVYRACKHS